MSPELAGKALMLGGTHLIDSIEVDAILVHVAGALRAPAIKVVDAVVEEREDAYPVVADDGSDSDEPAPGHIDFLYSSAAMGGKEERMFMQASMPVRGVMAVLEVCRAALSPAQSVAA